MPSDASVVVANATVWQAPADGGLRMWPADATEPSAIRDMSFSAGAVDSGTVQIALSAQGRMKVKALLSDADVTLDVTGWYLPATTKTTYAYNGDGIRTSKTSPKGNTTRFVYDMSQPVPRLLTDGKTDYLYGPDGTPIAALPNTGSTTPAAYYLTDALGSTRALTGTTGTVTGTYDYNPFGAVTAHTGADTPLQYGGGYTDPETGLIYLLARYYDPTTGIFTTPDPLLDITNQPYTYTGNDPLNQTDPTGQCPWCIAGALVGVGVDLAVQISQNVRNGCSWNYQISWGEVAEFAFAGFTLGSGINYLVYLRLGMRWAEFDAASEQVFAHFPRNALGRWGNKVWGHGADGARALLGARTAEELREIEGLSVETARMLRRFYAAARAVGKGGATAKVRVELLDEIIKLLERS